MSITQVKNRQLWTLLTLLTLSLLKASLLPASQGIGAGQQVPDLSFTDFSGEHHQLSDYSGRYLLLDFWATWCGPCVKEVPVLKKALELYQQRGLRIVGMNSDEKTEKARMFLEKNRVSWPQSAPESTKKIVDDELKVKWYPTMILLDPQRRIVFVSGDGKRVLKGRKLLNKLDEVLPPAARP